MLLPLPCFGAEATWVACSCSQGRRNEASRPVPAEESASGSGHGLLGRPCGPLLQMAVGVAPASPVLWPTARIFSRGAGLGHAGLDRTAHSLAGFDQRSQFKRMRACMRRHVTSDNMYFRASYHYNKEEVENSTVAIRYTRPIPQPTTVMPRPRASALLRSGNSNLYSTDTNGQILCYASASTARATVG